MGCKVCYWSCWEILFLSSCWRKRKVGDLGISCRENDSSGMSFSFFNVVDLIYVRIDW